MMANSTRGFFVLPVLFSFLLFGAFFMFADVAAASNTTTVAPKTTAAAPNTTTTAPNTTTTAPNTTTTAPNTTTTAPNTTTTSPNTTTVSPNTTTTSPNVTTVSPNVTTLSPNMTTSKATTTIHTSTHPSTVKPDKPSKFRVDIFFAGMAVGIGLVVIVVIIYHCYQSKRDILCEKQIKVELCQNELWLAFHQLGTEMIVTKSGRRMFPALRVKVSGLQAQVLYEVSLTFEPVDKRKYRYVYHNSKWMVAGVGDIIPPNQSYTHPNSPMSGSYIMSQVLSFEKIKLTNHKSLTPNQISLVSMQKFRPCIHLVEVINNEVCTNTEHRFSFTQTSFITVTAYQNQEITRLKIARNPFAKGFRKTNKHRSSLDMMLATLGMLYSHDTTVSHSVKNSSKKQKTVSSKADIPKSQVDWNYPHRATEMVGDWPAMTLTQNTPLQYRHNIRPDVNVSLNSAQSSSRFSDSLRTFATNSNKSNNNNNNNTINNDNNINNDANDSPYSKLCASTSPYPILASKFVSIRCPSSVVAVPSQPPPQPRPMLAPLLQPVRTHPLLLPLPLRVALPHPPLPPPPSLPLTFY